MNKVKTNLESAITEQLKTISRLALEGSNYATILDALNLYGDLMNAFIRAGYSLDKKKSPINKEDVFI